VFEGGIAGIGFILFLAFLLFGPRKLPEIARTLGKGLRDFRHASDDLKRSLEEEISSIESETNISSHEPSPYGYEQSEPSHQEKQSANRD
jgi:sec-independent protein translocase protein TatA